ncbi:hypothetical protein [Marinobacter sp. ATCH36]|uniref:hypothetical protein n=1 Tax=Marinobacter sp. ATCH36 TaxID=2945106 RepID=UPI00202098D7|nr:hypothetical protein [Marinobacter sp. ATCH36]MCL7944571.1 hypothetical protein [Marinobacter sp. ATCH36]
MDFGWTLVIQAAVTAASVLAALAVFWFAVMKPHLDRKVEEIIQAAREIEPGVKRGVREGVEETLRELPESTAKESSRQFLRFGSNLFENGLSSFLGDVPGQERKPRKDL